MKSKRPAIKWKIIRDVLRRRGRVTPESLKRHMTREQANYNLNAMKQFGELKRVRPATRRFRASLGRATGKGSVYTFV